MTFEEIIEKVRTERASQDAKWGVGFHGRADSFWLTILVEEVGEVANAILERDEENLETELVQAAAVLFSWLEFRTASAEQKEGRGLVGRRSGPGIRYS